MIYKVKLQPFDPSLGWLDQSKIGYGPYYWDSERSILGSMSGDAVTGIRAEPRLANEFNRIAQHFGTMNLDVRTMVLINVLIPNEDFKTITAFYVKENTWADVIRVGGKSDNPIAVRWNGNERRFVDSFAAMEEVNDLTVVDGVITNPGRFMGRNPVAPAFWTAVKEGLHDEVIEHDGLTYYIFLADKNEAVWQSGFGEAIAIWEENGAVMLSKISLDQLKNLKNQALFDEAKFMDNLLKRLAQDV